MYLYNIMCVHDDACKLKSHIYIPVQFTIAICLTLYQTSTLTCTHIASNMLHTNVCTFKYILYTVLYIHAIHIMYSYVDVHHT